EHQSHDNRAAHSAPLGRFLRLFKDAVVGGDHRLVESFEGVIGGKARLPQQLGMDHVHGLAAGVFARAGATHAVGEDQQYTVLIGQGGYTHRVLVLALAGAGVSLVANVKFHVGSCSSVSETFRADSGTRVRFAVILVGLPADAKFIP